MAIDFKMEKKGDYLLVTCQGPYTGKGIIAVQQHAIDYAGAEGLRAILMDATGLHGYSPTAMERFGFAEAVAELQRSRGGNIWIAFVGKEPLVDPGRFGETVAVNRGAALKVFEDPGEAADWIRERLATRDGAEGGSGA